jgi:HEAT repeat protein
MSLFVRQIENEASMGNTDLNKAAETILIHLLNEVYGWKLKNINHVEGNNNYPGIDLADEVAGISIQVTATHTLGKVKHTLEQFIKHNQYLKYKRLIIYILKEKQNSYSETAIQGIIQNKFSFDSQKDIWDHRDILKEVSNFPIDRALKVQEILEANFGENQKFTSLLANSLEQRIDWREICRELLNHWKGLTTNALTKPNGIRFQLDEIFVPLGVVERREKPKHGSNEGFPAEQGSELYEEKVTPISQNDFFEQVLRQRQSKYSQGSRIAIIGEPGAGKTTQLQKIGDWILKETDGIPIWIPLTALGTRKLKAYLLTGWLQTAIEELEVSQGHRDELGQLLKTGKVWLLLDGVDEMAIPDALHQIATQIREGWVRNVRVVLTCRLNVWDAGKNALDGFDVYRNLDFDYPTELHQFIDKWFATEPGLQQRLKAALEQPGKERIRDMVKNPLRLTLLCYSWQLRQGELPETKAGLYEWFIDAFYEWNKGKVPTKLSVARRDELNHALGELAKEAIDQEASRFRLREKFVKQFLGAADDEDSLFYLALQLGWLNRIGVAAENSLENVHAFFHPTFQEYFAALAIDNHHFLLRSFPENPNHPDASYRILEPQWKEVFLLWLGQTKVTEVLKERLISTLYHFEDGCGDFYKYRAFFLSASGVAEFKKTCEAEQIIDKLIQIALDRGSNISEEAEVILVETDRKRLAERLSNLLDDPHFFEFRERIAIKLGRANPESPKAIAVLSSLLDNPAPHRSRVNVARELGKVSPQNPKAISFLELLLDDSNLHYYDRSLAAEYLYEIDPGNPKITAAFIQMLHADKDESWWNADGRGEIGDGSRADLFMHLVQPIHGLERFSDGNKEVTAALIKVAVNCRVQDVRDRIILCLGTFDSTNAVWILNPALAQSKSEQNTLRNARLLGIADPGSWKVIGVFLNLLRSEDEGIRIEALRNLEEVGANMPEAVALYKAVPTLINMLEDMEWKYYQDNIAACLGEIGSCQPETISALENLLENSDDEYTQLKSAIALKKISIGHQKATIFLIKFLKNETRYSTCEYEFDMSFELLKMTRSSQQIIDMVRTFSKKIKSQTAKNNSGLYESYFDIIWYCTQNMSYPDFYQVWHSSSSANDELPIHDLEIKA